MRVAHKAEPLAEPTAHDVAFAALAVWRYNGRDTLAALRHVRDHGDTAELRRAAQRELFSCRRTLVLESTTRYLEALEAGEV